MNRKNSNTRYNKASPNKRRRTDTSQSTISGDFRIQRYYDNGPHNFTFYVIPLNKQGQPCGKSIRLKFNNLYSPASKELMQIDSKAISCTYKTYKTTNTVLSWRYTKPEVHDQAVYNLEYQLSYQYRFKAKAIDAFKDYNAAIKKFGWPMKYVQPIGLTKIERDPWYLIEWEDKIQDLGIAKDSKHHFNLTQCDAVGVAFHLDPSTDSRVLQYCVNAIDQLCHSKGGTIVYHTQFIQSATQTINSSEMNMLRRFKVLSNDIKEISMDRDDYFFVGRTEMHNMKLFISSRELWNAQNSIIKKIHRLVKPFNTPYYQERELIVNCIKGKLNLSISFDLISNVLSPIVWFNPETEDHIEEFMELTGIPAIDNIQRKAIHTSINEAVSIVSGGPGRGKSSCVLRGILHVLNKVYTLCYKDPIMDNYLYSDTSMPLVKDVELEHVCEVVKLFNETKGNGKDFMCVHVLSFTGKAVSRIKEVLKPKEMYSKLEPMTIHRLFARCNQYKWLTVAPTTIIVDEVSMVSDMLFYKLLKKFKNIQKIILLGDFDQLPPIQPGDLLQELILSRCVPVVRLVKNYRQGAGSGLPNIADKIIGRETRPTRNSASGLSRIYGGWDHALNIPTQKIKDDIYDLGAIFGGCDDCKVFGYGGHISEDRIMNDIVEQVRKLKHQENVDLFTDLVVLSAKRVEVAKLNSKLQPIFMGDDEDDMQSSQSTHSTQFAKSKGLRSYYEGVEFNFTPGDRIMHLENNYDINVFNGDVGRVVNIDYHAKRLNIVLEDDIEEKTVDLENIMPAYSQTVHKVQGSEYRIVVIYISDQASMLHVDQWLYTGFTRAKERVFIFGYTGEIISTVSKELKYRRTFLKHRLQLKCSTDLNDLVKDELTNVPK